MTNKQKILQAVGRWREDISFEEAVYNLYVIAKVEAGLRDLEAGRFIDHDALFDELERMCDEEESQNSLAAGSRERPKEPPRAHRAGRRPQNGAVVRKPAKKSRKSAS